MKIILLAFLLLTTSNEENWNINLLETLEENSSRYSNEKISSGTHEEKMPSVSISSVSFNVYDKIGISNNILLVLFVFTVYLLFRKNCKRLKADSI